MKLLFICIAIVALASCQKEGNESSKTRAQDNLAPVPARACSHYISLRLCFGDGNLRSPIQADRTLPAATAWQCEPVEP
ncbi:hypothetical protein NX871_27930, partial [Burkholderia thailandensis]|uniref:hypothetical protein n=1 Tax=Burkholderia thailandensis TaxID=57975 RepID=UPI00217CE674